MLEFFSGVCGVFMLCFLLIVSAVHDYKFEKYGLYDRAYERRKRIREDKEKRKKEKLSTKCEIR